MVISAFIQVVFLADKKINTPLPQIKSSKTLNSNNFIYEWNLSIVMYGTFNYLPNRNVTLNSRLEKKK